VPQVGTCSNPGAGFTVKRSSQRQRLLEILDSLFEIGQVIMDDAELIKDKWVPADGGNT
jgi:hypothetical protein